MTIMSGEAMEWLIAPHHGVGPLTIGVSAEDLRAVLASLPGNTGPLATRPESAQLQSGLSIFYEVDGDGCVESIEVWHPTTVGQRVVLDGVDLFGLRGGDLAMRLPQRDIHVLPGGGTALVRDADVGITLEDGVVVAVLVGVVGYYDFLGVQWPA
jgi:hypothetical protein